MPLYQRNAPTGLIRRIQMIFADLFFIYGFLILCLLLYFATKNIKIRNFTLVAFSIIFYTWGDPPALLILMTSVTGNYFCGLLIDKFKGTPKAKLGVGLSLTLSLGLLVVFKYTGFIVENLNAVLPFDIPDPKITLPLGISFYTFQIISYTLDCYWGKVQVQRNFGKFLMYVSLFPQLVAGPIVRYSVVEKEINNRESTAYDISYGITRFAFGLGKKVILANNLYAIVEKLFGGDISELSVLGTWYAVILYAMYVYFDFSGYSDMAIGLGRIFGFKFDENFNYPFICRNITELWQRWHSARGSFFRDYLLYIPIFGKRRQYLSLFLVWFSTGVWHGASWNYIIWGLYFGVFIFLERKIGNKRMKKIPTAIMHIYNKIVIVIGFGIFYFTDIGRLGTFFGNLVGANGNELIDVTTQWSFAHNIFLILTAAAVCMPVIPMLGALMEKTAHGIMVTQTSTIVCNIAILVISSILLVDATNNPFLYWIF